MMVVLYCFGEYTSAVDGVLIRVCKRSATCELVFSLLNFNNLLI